MHHIGCLPRRRNLSRPLAHLHAIRNPARSGNDVVRSTLEPSIDRREQADGRDDYGLRAVPSDGPTDFRFVAHKRVLGGRFRFVGNSRAMLDLVEAAYGGLPAQTLPATAARFSVELCLVRRSGPPRTGEPPAPRIWSEGGAVRAVVDASNHVVIEPARCRARVVASEDMLQHAYHLRCELIEFAVFILAARGIGLVPLHAACIGWQGRGLLLLGRSGSGKSTLALHGLLHGMELLAEDAVFVRPADLLATGVPTHLHLRTDALDLVQDDAIRRWIARAPVIRRRSGVEKFELDLRQGYGRPAASPLALTGAVFVSDRTSGRADALLTPLRAREAGRLLQAEQPYASGQPGWHRFKREIVERGIHQLRRGHHPRDSVDAIRRLLD